MVKTQIFIKLPVDIQQLIVRMLSRHREQRPQSVESVLSELLPLVEEEKTKVVEAPREISAVTHKETVIKYQRVNWLTIMLAVLMVVSIVLNVLLLGESSKDVRAAIISSLELYF